MTLAVHVGFIVMITFTEWNNDYTISIFKFWSTKKNFKSGQILLFHFPAGKDFFHKCASINAKCYDMGNIGYALYNTCYAPKPHETSWNISCTFPAISQRTKNGKITSTWTSATTSTSAELITSSTTFSSTTLVHDYSNRLKSNILRMTGITVYFMIF